MRARARKAWLRLAVVVALATALTRADPPRVQWIPLDNTPPGTPAEILLDRDKSSADVTVFDIVIHGFLLEAERGEAVRVTVPGLSTAGQPGVPELPVALVDLAVAVDAQRVELRRAIRIDRRSYDRTLIAPRRRDRPALSADQSPEQEESVYGVNAPWPEGDGVAVRWPGEPLGPVQGVTVEVYPLKYNPVSRTLTVDRRMRVEFTHAGKPMRMQPVSREVDELARKRFLNWGAIVGK